ncbi:hypothetical protein ACTXM3_15675 [Glutamicibacter arilaitensis]|uniref:Uncharacterized protein n=1 Tax=Glutamicibacter arilaitensis TaxID=256701 RepID=A0A2N7RZM5_9MICC|nr:hypothetical protein [Glutamicibacter arilaitensis]PMQ19344.1 hypothetical protein CIK84_11630 [Glutamicibacter arilaitensis]
MNIFKRGDRVAFAFDKSTTGTVTSSRKTVVRVLWDATGIETPLDPAELIHSPKPKKNDRGALAKEHTTASESTTQEKDESMSKTTGIECNAFIAATLRDKYTRDGIIGRMPTEALGAFADENSADPIEVAQAHMFAFGYGANSPELEEAEYSEDELHARLIEWGASERTTVHQLSLFALETDIDAKALFNAYASLGFIPNGGANNA